ncbi:MAG: hypothetical protein KDB16_02885, partial [Acidimicrobiales bacterium]|nr:hypothetical protein [Acidimicrobiales bacterium]
MNGPPGVDRQSLPIDPFLAEITDSIDAHPVTLVVAPPGCGKTTRVPAALLDDPRRSGCIVLEPRRVAARSAAHRIASEQRTVVGDRVGFSVRGERRVGNRTRLEVVTDGLFV